MRVGTPRHCSLLSVAAFLSITALVGACESSNASVVGDRAVDGGAAQATPEPTPEGLSEEPPPAGAADCRLRTSWDAAPSATCSPKAAKCIADARTAAALRACIDAERSCATCFSETVVGCLVGTPARPGVCAGPAGCVEGCVASACGESPTEACSSQAANTGACKGLGDELDTCLEKADQRPCVARFQRECVPAPSCGNKIVDGTETCDGDCPTSCPPPPPGDLCTRNVLKGTAATCSAVCEAQSVCPANCPSVPATSSSVGVIASGTALPAAGAKAAWPSLSELRAVGCPSVTSAPSVVFAWKAPAAGLYTFRGTCNVAWQDFQKGTGTKTVQALQCIRRIAIARGRQCAAGVTPFACSLDVDHPVQQDGHPDAASLAPVALTAGEEILVAADFGVRYLPPVDGPYHYGGSIASSSWSVSATTCTPSCTGKTCGSDGCGGSCGACAGGAFCNGANQCQALCTPSCAGKTCGSDGCGGSCGSCGGGQVCAGGTCQAPCAPACAGKACGPDGCGGSCGACGAGRVCDTAGQCAASVVCDPVDNTGCTPPNQCITLTSESSQCVLMGTGAHGSPCADSSACRGGHACFGGTCRKICDRATGSGCAPGASCAAVSTWTALGTCAP